MANQTGNDTSSIKEIAYPEVDNKLSAPGTEQRYKKFMAGFMNKRNEEFYANIPCKQMYYSTQDIEEWFRTTGIDRKPIKEGIKGAYFSKISNFNPAYAKDDSTVALMCMVRYYAHTEHRDEKMLNLALVNISFSGKFYPSVFYKHFRYPPAQHVMEYVLNNMITNKYDLMKYGNVLGAIRSVVDTWCATYKDRFTRFSDEDIAYLVQQLHNRIDSFVHNIAMLYYKAYQNRDHITYDSDNVSDDDYHIADNDSFRIGQIVENAMNELTSKNLDPVNIKRASNDMVKFNELKAIIDTLLANKDNIPIIKEFCTLMVSLYFQQSKFKDITDISFISYSIRPVPNSRDPHILRKKELMDQILLNNAENFERRRSRAATESAYYRAFNAYIALMIQKANK